MALLGNIIWFILVGWWNFLVYCFFGVLCCITIIGIPIGKSLFQYAKLMALPFGKVIVKETDIKGAENVSGIRKVGGVIANIIWLPFGIIFFLSNIVIMIASAITIIGIPSAVVIAKSCKFLIWPVGAKVIKKDDMDNIRMQRAIDASMQKYANNQTAVTVNIQAPTTAAPQISSDAAPNQHVEHLKENTAQVLDNLKAGGAQALDSLKENGGKVIAAAGNAGKEGLSELKRRKMEADESALKKDAGISIDSISGQLEANLHKNVTMSWIMTYLEYIGAAVMIIGILIGMIHQGVTYRGHVVHSVLWNQILLHGPLYGIVSILPIVYIVCVLGMIKRSHILTSALLGVEMIGNLLYIIMNIRYISVFNIINLLSIVVVLVCCISIISKTQPAAAANISKLHKADTSDKISYCGKCGTKITGDYTFCPECGAKKED